MSKLVDSVVAIPRMPPSRGAAHWWLARLVIAAVLLALGGGVQAQFLYKCVTAEGRRVTSDRPPPECADRPIDVLRADGTPYRRIEPPPTPEQTRKREEEERRKIDEEEARRSQRQSDRSLLETYASLEEIEAARKRALADQQKLIDRAFERKGELQRERKKLDDEAEFYVKRDMPEKLKREFAANNELMKTQDKSIANTKSEMERINQRFAAFARRFRELMAAGATPVQRAEKK